MSLALSALEARCEAVVVAPTTDTGYVSYGSKGRLFLPAGVNLAPQFGPDANVDGLSDDWVIGSPTVTGPVDHSLVTGRDGQGLAQRIQYTGVAGDAAGDKQFVLAISPSSCPEYGPGDVVTGSFYVGGALSGCTSTFRFIARDAAHDYINEAASTPVTPAENYVRYSSTYTMPALTAFGDIWITVSNIGEGDTVDIIVADAQLEESSIPTPYFVGTREASVLSGYPYAMALGDSGTMVSRFTPLYSSTNNPGAAVAICPMTSTRPRVYSPWTDSVRIVQAGTGGGTSEVNFGAFDAGSSHSLIARWTPTTLDIQVDGVNADQVAITPADFPNTTLSVGYDGGSANSANAYLGPVAMCHYRITDAETVLLNAMLAGGATAMDVFRFFQIREYAGTLVIPLEEDDVAYSVTAQPDAVASILEACTAAITAYMPHGLLVFDGDSWTEGEHYAPYVLASITPRPDIANFSVGGNGWAHFISSHAPLVDVAYVPLSQYAILAVVGGLNDYAVGSNPTTVIANMVSYCQGRRDAGYKVVVGSCGPDNYAGVDANYDANRATHNAYLAAHWSEFADAYADFTADPYIGQDDSPTTQSGYWANGSHPNATGYAVLASYVTTAVRSLIDPAASSALVAAKLDAVLLKTNTIGGAGAIEWPYTLTVNGMPCADAAVWVTTDEAGNNVVASGRTDDFGALAPVPNLDAGTYYFRAKKAGVNFEVDIEVVA